MRRSPPSLASLVSTDLTNWPTPFVNSACQIVTTDSQQGGPVRLEADGRPDLSYSASALPDAESKSASPRQEHPNQEINK